MLVQQAVEKLAQTAVDYPPMQDPASFNLEAVKKKIEEMIKNRPGQYRTDIGRFSNGRPSTKGLPLCFLSHSSASGLQQIARYVAHAGLQLKADVGCQS